MQVAEEYGNRLNRSNISADAIRRLSRGYPSHDFVIDRDEAQKLLPNVRECSAEEGQLLTLVKNIIDPDLIRTDQSGRMVGTVRYLPTDECTPAETREATHDSQEEPGGREEGEAKGSAGQSERGDGQQVSSDQGVSGSEKRARAGIAGGKAGAD